VEPAPRPDNESSRLQALREFDILDTLPEPAYDDITRIAAEICDTPIALVSLVDENRQWFKSRYGLKAEQTSRDTAFCAHAILEPDSLLIIDDATADPRFADNPLVTGDPGIRFYAGAPLVTSDGHALGTLCVIDRKPKRLSERQRETLAALARQVVAQMELRRSLANSERNAQALAEAIRALEQRNAQVVRSRDELAGLCRLLEDQAALIERDLNRAEVIQRSLLPHDVPRLHDVSLHTLYRPGRSIGGDLFDVVVVSDRYLVLVIADAAGHGVSAAMISMLFKHRLRLRDEDGRPFRPCEALAHLNEAMRGDKPAPDVFVTALVCLFDMQTRVLLAASAGHPPLIIARRDGTMELIAQTGPALGLYANANFGERSVNLEADDRVLLYTDGLFDSASDAQATPQRVGEVLSRLPAHGNTLGALLAELCDGATCEDRDDVSMILLECSPGENRLDETVELSTRPEAEGRRPVTIARADTDDRDFLVLSGRATWTCGQTLHDAAMDVLDAGRELVVDLGDCDYLDSTLLGTLHELAEAAAERGVPMQVQNVPDALLQAFRELSMHAVLDLVSDQPLPLPVDLRPVELPERSQEAHQRRLLRAHQVLAELSEENREEFSGVIEALEDGPPADAQSTSSSSGKEGEQA
jgi:phosphoserine phosphatase RsbU/P